MNIAIVFYFALGALFAFTASRVVARGGWSRITALITGAVLVLLVIGLWFEGRAPESERMIGFPILLALLSPTLAAAVVWVAATRGSSVVLQWVMGAVGWTAGLIVTSFAALALNWITF